MGFTVPIIGLTANADELSRKEAAEAGMVHCISKPLSISDLKQVLKSFNSHQKRP